METPRTFKIQISCLLLLLLPIVVTAFTIRVPKDYPTIQKAIDASYNGDTILVAPGSYNENIIIAAKNIYLIGEYGADSTFISGLPEILNGWITFKEGSQALLKGFTVTKKYDALGGIIIINTGASPTIERCLFTECYNSSSIIGVESFTDTLHPTRIVHCTFAENPGQGNSPRSLYSIYTSRSPVVIENCIFWNYNFHNEFRFESNAWVKVSYSLIRGGYPGIGNIDANPMFLDTASRNLRLDSLTPCCNAGNPNFPFDPDSTIADIGVFYSSFCTNPMDTITRDTTNSDTTSTDSLLISPPKGPIFTLYPNPAKDFIIIDLNSDYQNTLVELYNSMGMLVYSRRYSSVGQIKMDTGGNDPGIYYVQVIANNHRSRQKILLN